MRNTSSARTPIPIEVPALTTRAFSPGPQVSTACYPRLLKFPLAAAAVPAEQKQGSLVRQFIIVWYSCSSLSIERLHSYLSTTSWCPARPS